MSDNVIAMSPKSAQVLMRSLARLPLDVLAQALSKDESTASRVRSGEARVTVGEFCDLLDAAGLKVVSREKVCVDKQKYEALATLAVAAMSDKQTIQRLVWEDE